MANATCDFVALTHVARATCLSLLGSAVGRIDSGLRRASSIAAKCARPFAVLGLHMHAVYEELTAMNQQDFIHHMGTSITSPVYSGMVSVDSHG